MRQTSASTTSPRRTTNGSKATLPAAAPPQFTSNTKVDLCAAVRDACAEVAAALAYSGHLDIPHTASALTVPADMAALVLIIVREAVANAVKYAHPTGVEGKIFVACARESNGAIGISVIDDGVGLPENFDPATDGGTGLHLMRASSERLGARLTFKSNCLGLVVRLRVEMPTAARAANGRSADANGTQLPEAALPAEHGSQLLEALPAAVYTTDAKGLITFYNAAAATLWGCRPQLGKSEFCGSWKLYWPDGTPLPHDECPMAMALKQKKAIRGVEAVAERPDGTRVPFIPYPTPLFDASGDLAGAVNMLVDITERKRAEEALARRSEEQSALYQFTDRLFRAGTASDVYDAALDAIQRALGCERASILLLDASDTMKFVAWRGLSEGYRRAVEGHSPWTRDAKDPQPICLSDLETADLPETLAATVRAEGIGALAFIPLLADGRLIGKFMTYYEAPHAFDDAEVDLAVTIARQLGFSLERMRADAARRRAEEDLSDFFENASVGLHWAGPDGTILRANRRELEMLGYGAEEYVGRNVSEFHVDKSVAADILQRLSAGEVLHNYFSQLRCKDGSVREVSIASSVLWDGDRFLHTRCFTRDITDLRRADHAAHLLASIVETSDDAIVSKDLDGIVTSWNSGAQRVFGYTAEEMIGRSITTLIPDGRHDEEPEILGRIRRGDRIQHYETVRRRKDGTFIDVSLTVSPVKDASGKIVGASEIARDVTAQKRAQERQELLTREIDHRTKNLFAVVHAVVARSFMGKRTVKDAEEAVLSRLRSLAQTHVMLIDKEWHGADLAEVLRSELSPHADRVRVEGPKLLLSAKAAQNFALAVHELATNAAKYGALSTAAGRVDIGWSVVNSNGSGSFKFRWQERGGPPVSPPLQKGFGSVVLEQVMAEYFETPPKVDFAPAGVTYEINGSLDAIAANDPPAPPKAAAPAPRAKRPSPSRV